MMSQRCVLVLALVIAAPLSAEVPDVNDFRVIDQFPAPAENAFSVVGAATGNGRFVVWNGETVFIQDEPGGALFEEVATGYVGDPAFATLSPGGGRILLGAGFGDGSTANLYIVDVDNPADFQPGVEILAPSHFSGVFLNNNLVALDRSTDDFSASEIVVFDLSVAKNQIRYVPILSKPAGSLPRAIIDKPQNSFSSTVNVDPARTLLYVMDANVRELRSFVLQDVVAAFQTGTSLDWELDGAPIGVPGQFFSSGVAGTTPDSELVIGGSEGFGLPGGIQFVDPVPPASVLGVLDPAGTMPFYGVIYSRTRDELIAIDATNAPATTAFATERGVATRPPESPCGIFDMIDEQFDQFLADLGIDEPDLDVDGLPDEAQLGLVEAVSCGNGGIASLVAATRNAYDLNLRAADAEQVDLSSSRELVSVLTLISQGMQDAVRPEFGLAGVYEIVTCMDGGDGAVDCQPDTHMPGVRVVPRSPNEPFSSDGDLDGDGVTNQQEFDNVIANGGGIPEFVVAATNRTLDGTDALTGGGGGGCFIATAAYGTPLSSQIDGLRQFRDRNMLGHVLGVTAADVYYRTGALVVPIINDRPMLKALVRAGTASILHPEWLAFGALALIVYAVVRRSRPSARR